MYNILCNINWPLQKGKGYNRFVKSDIYKFILIFFFLFMSCLGTGQTQTPKNGNRPLNYPILAPVDCHSHIILSMGSSF